METVQTTRGEQRAVWFDGVTERCRPWAQAIWYERLIGRIVTMRGADPPIHIFETVILGPNMGDAPTVVYVTLEGTLDRSSFGEPVPPRGPTGHESASASTYREATEQAIEMVRTWPERAEDFARWKRSR